MSTQVAVCGDGGLTNVPIHKNKKANVSKNTWGTIFLHEPVSSICAYENRVICKVTLSSPCLWVSFGLLSSPIPCFSGIRKDILLNLSMKCCNSTLNAQGSRLIIVVVQLGVVKIYVAAAEALMKKERQDETQFTTKVDGFLSFIPP